MLRFLLFIILGLTNINLLAQSLTVDEKVDSLLQLMTLEEKIGQMAQAERGALEKLSDISFYKLGSLLSGGGSAPETNNVAEWAKMYDNYQQEALKTRLRIPLIYGIDAVHGHNNVYGAVIFPHNIGLGCTRNPDLIEEVNRITAKEVAATGIDWTFSPCIAVPKNEKWGRTYEGFGETTELQKTMSAASIKGLQSDLSNSASVLACAKHFVGDGGTTNGIDQGNTEISEELLRSLHMQGYIDAIENKVGSIMASYNSWNGQKLHGHDYLLTTVLKDELGFEGFVISDWQGVDQIDEDYREAVKRAINAGIDMVMVPDRYIYFISILQDLVSTNEVSNSRIDDAVGRILKQKFLLNLFAEPLTDNTLSSSVGSAEHRVVAKQAVRESLVLLSSKNNVLPLQKNGQKILVAGRLADDLGAQCGGWSISWQGSNGDITEGTTILEGLLKNVESSSIIYSANGETSQEIDIAVIVIGEDPYAEGAGDKSNLAIDQADIDLAKKLKEQGVPVIAVLISGRPMIIGELLPYTDAFFAAWLPGTEGDGIAEVLFGDYEPSGLLSHSWPKHMSQIPINYGDNEYDPLFPYKHGVIEFPDNQNHNFLTAYAAKMNDSGDQLILTLNNNITFFEPQINDFTVFLDGVALKTVSELLNNDSDKSMVLINLSESINSSESLITLSYSGAGINSENAILEPFSNYYVHNASIELGVPIDIPGRVEAEAFYAMSGIGTEPTTDIGGGENVGWIENGDWMDYHIDVTTTGEYQITARIAGYVGGTLTASFNNDKQASIDYSSTDGWQNWRDFTTKVFLEEGQNSMRIKANTDGFNINYFDFSIVNPVLGFSEGQLREVNLYPNPIDTDFNLEFINESHGFVKIGLYDINGILVEKLFDGLLSQGKQFLMFSLKQELKHAVYVLEIRNTKTRYFKKLIKN